MPVSSGLQKYFDAQHTWKKDDTQAKLDSIASQLDPAFSQSFLEFRERILWIVSENPNEEEIIQEELNVLSWHISNSQRVHNLKKASVIITATEKK